MFARVFKSTVTVSVVAFLAITGVPAWAGGSSQCDNGDVQCCKTMQDPNSLQPDVLGGLLGIFGLQDIADDIGVNCDPVNVVGLGAGANCDQQAVCCENVTQNGMFNFGCSPISLL